MPGMGPAPSAPPSLDGLTDVDTAGVAGLDVLSYDADAEQWGPRALATSEGAIGQAPTLLDTLAIADLSAMWRYSDDYLIAAAIGTLHIIDWSGRTLDIVAQVADATHLTAPTHVQALLPFYALVVGRDGTNNTAALYDVSNPLDPSLVNGLVSAGAYYNAGALINGGWWVADAQGGFGFTTREWTGSGGLTNTSGDTLDLGSSTDMRHLDVRGARWLLGCGDGGLNLIDAASPTNLVLRDSLGPTFAHEPAGVARFYDDQYIVWRTKDEVRIVDWSDPDDLTVVGTVALPSTTPAQGLAIINGDYAIAGGASRFDIIDWSDPTAPAVHASATGLAELGGATEHVEYRPGVAALSSAAGDVIALYDTTT